MRSWAKRVIVYEHSDKSRGSTTEEKRLVVSRKNHYALKACTLFPSTGKCSGQVASRFLWNLYLSTYVDIQFYSARNKTRRALAVDSLPRKFILRFDTFRVVAIEFRVYVNSFSARSYEHVPLLWISSLAKGECK